MKRFLYYFGWTIMIGVIIYLGLKYRMHLEKVASIDFSFWPILWFATIFPIVTGMLFRLPKLIMEIKEKRQWDVDWVKIVAIALPALCIVLIPILFQTPIIEIVKLDFLLHMMISVDNVTLITIAGIVSGYVLLDSLKAKPKSD